MGNGFLRDFRIIEERVELTGKFNFDLIYCKNCLLKWLRRSWEGFLFLLLIRIGLNLYIFNGNCLRVDKSKMKDEMF